MLVHARRLLQVLRRTRSVVLALSALLLLSGLPAAQGSADDAVPLAREVVRLLSSGAFDKVEALFLPPMTAALPPGQLASGWNAVTAAAGAFKQQRQAQAVAKGALRVVVVNCEFERASVDVQAVFDADGKIAGLSIRPAQTTAEWTPPAYARPDLYREHEVTVGAPDWALPGTLTMPVGNGAFRGVVLVHGSGPQDRDTTLGPNKVFKDIALGLASRGIAVLRYEKRSKQHPQRLSAVPSMTVKDETIDDAVAAAAWLRKAPNIDPARVFVLGHSLGGMLVPRIASADSLLAGFIVMAGSVRSLEQAMVDQTRHIIEADGQVSTVEQQQLAEVEKLAAAVRALDAADRQSPRLIGGAPPSYWLDLRGYDPPAAARGMAQPLFVLQGERDYQVTMAEFERWKTGLAGKPNVTFRSYSALNHQFMPGTGPSVPAEYFVPGHVDPQLIDDLANWIGRQ
jgi:hypothetical protein